MDIRTAILLAADHIERNPASYDFAGALTTPGPSDKGCLVGWIAHYAGLPAGMRCGTSCSSGPACEQTLGVTFSEFFQRMVERSKSIRNVVPFTDNSWGAANTLRAYADKYHPATKPEGIPDSVRNIFTMTAEQLKREIEAA